MAFRRADDGSVFGSNLEKVFEEQLNKSQEPSITDYVRASFGKVAYPTTPQIKKVTVADMVNDLMVRTGLKDYLAQVNSSVNAEALTTKAAQLNQELGLQTENKLNSLADYPGFEAALQDYISSYKHHQISPVLHYIEHTLKPAMLSRGVIPQEMADLAVQHDPKIIGMIKELIAQKYNKSVNDMKELFETGLVNQDPGSTGQVTPALEHVEPDSDANK